MRAKVEVSDPHWNLVVLLQGFRFKTNMYFRAREIIYDRISKRPKCLGVAAVRLHTYLSDLNIDSAWPRYDDAPQE